MLETQCLLRISGPCPGYERPQHRSWWPALPGRPQTNDTFLTRTACTRAQHGWQKTCGHLASVQLKLSTLAPTQKRRVSPPLSSPSSRGTDNVDVGAPAVAATINDAPRRPSATGALVASRGLPRPRASIKMGASDAVALRMQESRARVRLAAARGPSRWLNSALRHSTLLMGQFNYNVPFHSLLTWHALWSSVFSRYGVANIVCYGPFSAETLTRGTDVGFNLKMSNADRGFVSPIHNLIEALRNYRKHSFLTGLLYVHDDMLMDVAQLPAVLIGHAHAGLRYGFAHETACTGSRYTVDEKVKDKWFRSWPSNLTFAAMRRAEADPRAQDFKDDDGRLRWHNPSSGSDAAYVPLSLAHSFLHVGQWLVDNNVFLEIAMPNIFHFIVQRRNREREQGQQTNSGLCGCSSPKDGCMTPCPMLRRRTAAETLRLLHDVWKGNAESCMEYHPVKIRELGDLWTEAFNLVVLHAVPSNRSFEASR